MKKKFLFLSALVAATTAFVSCSSDENLAEVPDVVEETPAKTGTPFSVVVANDDGTTRATLIDNTSLGSFKLFAKQGSAAPWINGNVFKFEDSKWNPYQGSTAVEMSWPTEDKETASNFYAYSDNSTDGITVSATPTTSCVVTDNLANGSFVYKMYVDPNPANHALRVGGRDSSPTYTSEDDNKNIVDLSKQSDLLVASTTQNEAAGTTVPLHFRHALSSLAFKARFTSFENGETTGQINDDETLTIYWMRIRGLKGGGTFTFPTTDNYDTTTHRWATNPWTAEGGTDVVYEWVFGEEHPFTITAQHHLADEAINIVDMTDHTEMLIVPQTFTPYFKIADYPTGGPGYAPTNCYIELGMKGSSRAVGRSIYYMPLAINSTNNTFLAGVQHTLILNFKYLTNSSGAYQYSPSDAAGAPPVVLEIE